MSDLNKIFEAVLKAAESKFNEGTFTPVVFILSPSGVAEIPMFNREATRAIVRVMLEKLKGTAVITAMEGWAAIVPVKQVKELDNIRPKDHESAKEILIVLLESRYERRSVTWDVVEGRLSNKHELPSINMMSAAVGGYFDDPGAQA